MSRVFWSDWGHGLAADYAPGCREKDVTEFYNIIIILSTLTTMEWEYLINDVWAEQVETSTKSGVFLFHFIISFEDKL